MRNVLLLLSTSCYVFYDLNKSIFKDKKGSHIYRDTNKYNTSVFNLQFLTIFVWIFMERKEQKHYKITFLMIYNTYFVGYIVSEISVEKWKLLTLIIHGTGALLYAKEIYQALYIPLYGSNMMCGG